jgi:signal transduction histidine kinase
VAGTLLGLLAAAESIAHAAGAPQAGNAEVTALYSLALALATTLPLALLWAEPAAAGAAVSAACVLSLAAFQSLTVTGAAAQLIAGYRLGRHGSQPLAVILAAPYLVLALAGHPGSEAGVLTVLLASLAPAAALAGIARRARGEALENRAARQVIADTLLEHTARGERARIARELHDVVAHHISMVAVQAETARLTTPGMPAVGAQRLAAIADRQPQPGLRQLNDLLDAARDASGAGTRFILRGPPVTLDPGVELAAYRIVQEALTNARRYAPGAAVDVELHYADDGLRLRIRDNGPGPPPTLPAGGHGLQGMHERAMAAGGELHIGAAGGGGFLVAVRLPRDGEAAE